MFAVRNAIVGAMDAIVAYNWIDPRDETKLNGASMGADAAQIEQAKLVAGEQGIRAI